MREGVHRHNGAIERNDGTRRDGMIKRKLNEKCGASGMPNSEIWFDRFMFQQSAQRIGHAG